MWTIVDTPHQVKISTLQEGVSSLLPMTHNIHVVLILEYVSFFVFFNFNIWMYHCLIIESTMQDALIFGFHQGTFPLTTPSIHFSVSDLRLDIALIVPYSRVLGIKNIFQVRHKYSQKYICYGLDLVSDV